MNWGEVKGSIQADLLSRGLKQPRIRLGALDRLEQLFKVAYPGFEADVGILSRAGRQSVELSVGHLKAPVAVNSAEKSILGEIFRRLDGRSPEATSSSEDASASVRATSRSRAAPAERGNKLLPIAEAVALLLEREFGHRATFALEATPSWLPAWPSALSLGDLWSSVCAAYAGVLDGTYDLEQQVRLHASRLAGRQRVDVWFEPPYSFVLEYDERQHFNQFRAATLGAFEGYEDLPFEHERYVRECARRFAPPGTSGFARLKSVDPMFPDLYSGERQDNRIRQRAFRDFLKDIVPLTRSDVNPTRRIGAYLLGWKTKDFTSQDKATVCAHLLEFGALDSLMRGAR